MDENQQQLALNKFETLILAGDNVGARSALRELLFGLADIPVNGSVADVVGELANRPAPPAAAASVMLRAIARKDFLQHNETNHFNRNIVTLVEKSLSGLCEFFKLTKNLQTFEKYEKLLVVKIWVDQKLKPLRTLHTTLDSLLASRREISDNLSHGKLIEFGEIYRIREVKDAIDAVFSCLHQVSTIPSTLAADVETCEQTIRNAKNLASEYPSFITIEFLDPFLAGASKQLHQFINSLRGRFTSLIAQDWVGTDLPKRYPLLDNDRSLRILIPFRSGGPGAAVDVEVNVSSDSQTVMFLNEKISLGSVSPGKFSVALDALVVDSSNEVSVMLEIKWGEVGTATRQSEIFVVRVMAQASGVRWQTYTYGDPYSTGPAEGDDFVGRQEQVQILVARMLRRQMEPSYITGQKRVGKTSLATASAKEAQVLDPKSKFFWQYILWGEIAHEDPRVSVQQLGKQIEEFIIGSFPRGIDLPSGSYEGSLSLLVKLSTAAKAVDPERRFVIIIDEFDEMPQDLYLQGNLADTVFGNLRALTATSNICLLLVGGENMPFVMDRQGQKLNKFSRVNLTYFNRSTEWDDYSRIIREPSAGFLTWHDDAVAEVYDFTNGNPYFSKIICSKVYARALRERDVDVTREEVIEAVNAEISRLDDNLFAHLWQDGIFVPSEEREPIILKRKRVLAAFARCVRANLPVTFENIHTKRTTADISEADLRSILADFVRREVLVEEDGFYRAVLPIFQLWLADIGLTRLAADALSQSLAADAQRAEDEARVLAEELVALTDKWPTYRGRVVGPEQVRAWLNQRSSCLDQRALFTILQATRFFSEAEVLERIRNGRLTTLGFAEAIVRRSNSDRRSDVVITYVDGEGKSGQKYASLYAEENLISIQAILPPSNFSEAYRQHVRTHRAPKVIVIVDDIVGTGESLAANLVKFHNDNESLLNSDRPLVFVFALLATVKGQNTVLSRLSELAYDQLNFRAGEILHETESIFADPKGVFPTAEARDRAKSLATDIGVTIYRNNPLGFGGMGLSIVFPTTVPNNSLPLLHSRGKGSMPQWYPLFERLIN